MSYDVLKILSDTFENADKRHGEWSRDHDDIIIRCMQIYLTINKGYAEKCFKSLQEMKLNYTKLNIFLMTCIFFLDKLLGRLYIFR